MKTLHPRLPSSRPKRVTKPFVRTVTVAIAFTAITATGVGLRAQQKAPGPIAKNTIIRDNKYYYNAFNRRDPFASLIVGEFVSEKAMDPVDISQVELVGIVYGDLDRFAALEDTKGFAYIVRAGDRVRNGTIVAVGDESLVARVTNFGQTRKLTLHLDKREKGVWK